MTWRRAAATAAAVVATALVAPAGASAITIESFSTTPSSTQAGSHPNFTLSMNFGGGSTPKSMRIELPPGFVGNPAAAAKCPVATFEAGGCGADSVVGTTTVRTAAGLGGNGQNPLAPILEQLGPILGPLNPIISPLDPVTCGLLGILCTQGGGGTSTGASTSPGGVVGGIIGGLFGNRAGSRATQRQALELPLAVPGTVYNLEPNPGEPARLGIQLLGIIRLQSAVDLRDTTDFGLTSILDNLPNSFSGLPLRVTGMDLTLQGATAAGGTFVTLPTRCSTATTNVSVVPYEGEPASGSASFTPTDCQNVPFTPALGVTPSTTEIDQNAQYAISLAVPDDNGPIRQSHVSETRVSLPEGTALNPGSAQGLEACTDAQFGKGERRAPSCPAASQVGTVSFTSPLVGTLNGTVYEGEPKPGQMIRLLVDVPGPGFRIKLLGDVNPDPKTGQVHSVFANLPQLPFTGFVLTFRGGPKSILVTPPTCGLYTSTATLVPNSGTTPQTPNSAFTATYNAEGAPCPDELPFTPTVSATVDPSTAGAATAMTQVVARETKTQRLKDMELSFPPGLVGGLGGGIGLCEVGKAREGACPADSRVGSAALVAGPGPEPLSINGDVFVVAPFKEGTLASLAITVPGKVGPFDLGTTVSFAHISVRKSDSGLEVVANDLPQIVGGIPLNLRRVNLKLDRKGFMRNATSCKEQELAATFTSLGGAKHRATTPYKATGCDKVPFEPKLRGVIQGASQLDKGEHPAVTTLVTQKEGEIASREVEVTLPPEVTVDFSRVSRACPEGDDCGTRNVIGEATAVTPLLPIPLTGPVKLITPKGGGLPGLQLDLAGLLSISLKGKAEPTTAGLRNTFSGIPDVPLTRFELRLKGGKEGVLAATRDLRCGQTFTGKGRFVGHDDREVRTTGPFEVCGDLKSATGASTSKKAKLKARAVFKKGKLKVTLRGTKKLKRAKITLPKPAAMVSKKAVVLKAGAKARMGKATKRSLVVKKLGKKKVVVVMGKQALRGGKKADAGKRKLKVKATVGKRKIAKRVKIR